MRKGFGHAVMRRNVELLYFKGFCFHITDFIPLFQGISEHRNGSAKTIISGSMNRLMKKLQNRTIKERFIYYYIQLIVSVKQKKVERSKAV